MIKYLKLCIVSYIVSCSVYLQSNISHQALLKKYGCCTFPQFTCTDDTFCQLYPNQNMCELLQEIPQELRCLPYVIYPNCSNYNIYRFIYNKRFNIFPHAIIKPCTQEQLIYALKILRKYNLDFSIRSGGHCFEDGSLSMGYIIDLENFNDIRINTERQEAYIGAGNRLGCVIQALGRLGYAIPTGDCGTNGVAGLTLGGGLGFMSRKFGLTCDVVKSITLVTADGSIITVDDNNYSDLFWALRGAGNGSFGIVTGFTFTIFYVPVVSFLKLKFMWDPATVPALFNAWQSWMLTLPEDITTEIDFGYTNGQKIIVINALKVGQQPFTQWQNIFTDFNPEVNLKLTSYTEAARGEAGDSPLPFLKSRSKMIFQPLTSQAIQLIVNFFEQLTTQNKRYTINLQIGSAGGKIREKDTAYFPRQAIEWFFQHMRWNDQNQQDQAIHDLNVFYNNFEQVCLCNHSYTNLADYELGINMVNDHFLDAYYGDHVDRLIQIKNKYDPANFFKWKQSIPLARL